MKNSIKREQSQTGLNSAERENFRTSCKKYIYILNAVSVMAKLLKEKRAEGVLFFDENTSRLTFKAYNRQPRKRDKERMVKKLPWGWVKETMERIKVCGSFPKELSTPRVMGLLEEHTKEAKNALIDRELDLIEFC